MSETINAYEVRAEHHEVSSPLGSECSTCKYGPNDDAGEWPCEPYLLASEVIREREAKWAANGARAAEERAHDATRAALAAAQEREQRVEAAIGAEIVRQRATKGVVDHGLAVARNALRESPQEGAR